MGDRPTGDQPQPPGDQTGSAADTPLDRPEEQDRDADDDGPDHQQRDRYQPL